MAKTGSDGEFSASKNKRYREGARPYILAARASLHHRPYDQ